MVSWFILHLQLPRSTLVESSPEESWAASFSWWNSLTSSTASPVYLFLSRRNCFGPHLSEIVYSLVAEADGRTLECQLVELSGTLLRDIRQWADGQKWDRSRF